MNNLWTDTGFVSINKKGEQLCGDKVEIMETRPLSKDKRWRVTAIITKAK